MSNPLEEGNHSFIKPFTKDFKGSFLKSLKLLWRYWWILSTILVEATLKNSCWATGNSSTLVTHYLSDLNSTLLSSSACKFSISLVMELPGTIVNVSVTAQHLSNFWGSFYINTLSLWNAREKLFNAWIDSSRKCT